MTIFKCTLHILQFKFRVCIEIETLHTKGNKFDNKWSGKDLICRYKLGIKQPRPWTIFPLKESIFKKNLQQSFRMDENDSKLTVFYFSQVWETGGESHFVHRERFILTTENRKKSADPEQIESRKILFIQQQKLSREQYVIECGMKNENRITQPHKWNISSSVVLGTYEWVWKQFILNV